MKILEGIIAFFYVAWLLLVIKILDIFETEESRSKGMDLWGE